MSDEKLRKLAEAAEGAGTGVEWRYEKIEWRAGFTTKSKALIVGDWWSDTLPPAVAKYIARVHPEIVLELLDRVEASEAECDRLRVRLDQAEGLLSGLVDVPETMERGEWVGVSKDAYLAALRAVTERRNAAMHAAFRSLSELSPVDTKEGE